MEPTEAHSSKECHKPKHANLGSIHFRVELQLHLLYALNLPEEINDPLQIQGLVGKVFRYQAPHTKSTPPHD